MPELNKERIYYLADVIEKLPTTEWVRADAEGKCPGPEVERGFSMYSYVHECGAPACICGWANHLFPLSWEEEEARRMRFGSGSLLPLRQQRAAYALGIKRKQIRPLFIPEWITEGFSYSHIYPTESLCITSGHAAATLRILANTGRVDWKAGFHSYMYGG